MKLRVRAGWLPRALLGGALALLWTSPVMAQGAGGAPGGSGTGLGGPTLGGLGGTSPGGSTPLSPGTSATGRGGASGGAVTPTSSNFLSPSSSSALGAGYGPSRQLAPVSSSTSGSSSGTTGGTGSSSSSGTSTSTNGFTSTLNSSSPIQTLKAGSLSQPLYASATSTSTGSTGSNLGNTTGFSTVGTRRAPVYTTTIGFRPGPRITSTEMQADIRQALDRSPRLTNGQGIQVAVNGPTVVLQGTVASERERRVAELVVRMSRGVRDVRNELRVPAGP